MAIAVCSVRDLLLGLLGDYQPKLPVVNSIPTSADSSLTQTQSAVNAEILLGALDGLAFRWSLDPTFDLERYARMAAHRLK